MKICYVTHEPSLTGASQSLLDLLDGLKDRDVDPIVLLRKEGPLEDELKKRNIDYRMIYYAQSIKLMNRRQRIKTLVKGPLNVVQERKITEFLISEGIDLIHNNSLLAISGMNAARKAGIPYICHIRELLEEDHQLIPTNPADMAACIRDASKCISISQFVYEKFKEIIPVEKSIVLHNGISVSKYYQEHKPLFDDDTIKVLIAGRIQEGKRQLDAIKAVERISEAGDRPIELFVAGGDAPATDYSDRIRRYVEERKLSNIHFLGFTDLKELRSSCDINLICSSNEAMGRVTIEGMLSGCLVIGADAGATPEILRDGDTGYQYRAGDDEDLATCIIRAAKDKEGSNRIARQGQQGAKAFDSMAYANRIMEIYDEISKSTE